MPQEGEEDALLPLNKKEDIEQRLDPFLKRHPASKIDEYEREGVHFMRIDSPWADPTLTTLLPQEPEFFDLLAATLNKVFLPERLSAVWHLESKDLEVIWTAHNLSEDQKEVSERQFVFHFAEAKYQCEFGESSEELLMISKYTMPRTNPSATAFRNLRSYAEYNMADTQEEKTTAGVDKPRSFWIRGVDLSEKSVIPLIECLNFYMSYYDARSPRVLIHDVHDEVIRKTRYILGGFPKEIAGKSLDETLMSFWDATRQPNAMLKFIFYYRIIEYVASHYLDTAVRAKLVKILSNPALAHNVNVGVEEIVSAFDGTKADEVPRFNNLLLTSVSPAIVWREIERNKAYFYEPTKFDGGYHLAPIISKEETEATFKNGGMIKFANAIRNIRNVLVHGRDQNSATAITPTPRNLKHLSAWINAIAAAAGEVVLYGNNG